MSGVQKKGAAREDCAHSLPRRIGNSRCAQWKEQCAEEANQPKCGLQQEKAQKIACPKE
jgi:hypothetical protein